MILCFDHELCLSTLPAIATRKPWRAASPASPRRSKKQEAFESATSPACKVCAVEIKKNHGHAQPPSRVNEHSVGVVFPSIEQSKILAV
tara:strand:- start:115 stop:381 length:267 start_codon:yes stop_codon:yes gene_type:complete